MNRYVRNAATRAKGADRNTALIIETYRAHGASVLVLTGVGGGAADLLVGYRGQDKMREVKPAIEPGEVKPSQSRLRETQERFHALWRGAPIRVVRTIDDVVADLKAWEGKP